MNIFALNYLAIGSVLGFLSVCFGAFASHMLKATLSESRLTVFNTAVFYHTIYALVLCLVGVCLKLGMFNQRLLVSSGACFVAGIFFFSGSLYLLSLIQVKWLGAITPIGGLLFLAGWVFLVFSSLNK